MALRFLLGGVDMGTSVVRLGKIPGFITQAELGSVGIAGIPFDDPAGTLTVNGWQTFTVDESAGPTGQQRVFTGYIADRKYQRGTGSASTSLITSGARLIDTSIVELNTMLSFRLFPPSDTAAKRPAETDVQRVQWLLTTTYLAPTVHDYGFVNTSGGISMDSADYRGQSAYSLLNDCAQASGKNFFVYFDESHNAVGLFYDFDTSTNYTCTLNLSDTLADYDGVTTFIYDRDAYLERDPSRVYSGVQVPYSGPASPVYVSNATTASRFVARDTTAPNVNTKSSAVATASGNRYLTTISTESDRIFCTVQVPAAKAPLIRSGMRIQFKSTFMPGMSSYVYCRIMRAEVKQDEETDQLYNIALELIPPDPTIPLGDGVLSWNVDDVLSGTPPTVGSNPTFWVNGNQENATYGTSFYQANHSPYDQTILASDLVHGTNVIALYIENSVFAGDWAHNPTMVHFRFVGADGTTVYSPGSVSAKVLPIRYWTGSWTAINSVPANWYTSGFNDSGWASSVDITNDGHWPANDIWPSALYITPYGAVNTNLNGLNWIVRIRITLP